MQFFIYAILWALYVLTEAHKDTNSNINKYCGFPFANLCRNKGIHVGCKFAESVIGPRCRNYTKIEFDDKLRQYVTNHLNRRRHDVASGTERVRGGQLLPSPEIMMFVSWDSELAMLAQRLADQCSLVHDDCRATEQYPFAGQTVGAARWRYHNLTPEDTETAIHVSIERIFEVWWSEKFKVTAHDLVQPFKLNSPWGHFSQLAVWSLKAIGCGAALHGDTDPRFLLVCDYSHTNMLGQKTLTYGALMPCPKNMARRPMSLYPLLCAPIITTGIGNYNTQKNAIVNTNTEELLTTYDEDNEIVKELTQEIENVFTQKVRFTTEKPRFQKDFAIVTSDKSKIGKNTKRILEGNFESVNAIKIRNQWLTEKQRREDNEKNVQTRPTIKSHISTESYLHKVQNWEVNEDDDDYETQVTGYRSKWVRRQNKHLRSGEQPLFQPNLYDSRQALYSPPKFYTVTMDADIIIQIYNDTGFKKEQ